MTSKIISTLGYCNWRTLAAGWSRLYPDFVSGWRHYFIDCSYPLKDDIDEEMITSMCSILGVSKFKVDDDGAASNFNRAIMPLVTPDSFVAGIDPDDYIVGPADSLDRAVTLLSAIPAVACVAMETKSLWDNIKSGKLGGEYNEIAGIKFFVPQRPEVMGITVWRGSFLLDAGGVKQQHRWYGGMESLMFEEASKRQMSIAYMMGSVSTSVGEAPKDPRYRKWKDQHLAGDQRSFGEWLKHDTMQNGGDT